MSSNLENVKAGDKLIRSQLYVDDAAITVDRVTKTQIIVDTVRYRKSDGHRTGSSHWNSPSLRIPKQGEWDQVKEYGHKKRLAGAILRRHEDDLAKLPTETLEALVKAMEELASER